MRWEKEKEEREKKNVFCKTSVVIGFHGAHQWMIFFQSQKKSRKSRYIITLVCHHIGLTHLHYILNGTGWSDAQCERVCVYMILVHQILAFGRIEYVIMIIDVANSFFDIRFANFFLCERKYIYFLCHDLSPLRLIFAVNKKAFYGLLFQQSPFNCLKCLFGIVQATKLIFMIMFSI